jgi:hypothetical protein
MKVNEEGRKEGEDDMSQPREIGIGDTVPSAQARAEWYRESLKTYRVLRGRRIMSGRVILRLTSVPLRRWILSLSIRVAEVVGVGGHL